jgi:hypothetical protein
MQTLAHWFRGVRTEPITAIATVVLAFGTLLLALVAIFPDTVRGWFYYPVLKVSFEREGFFAVPITKGTITADSFYLRLWVQNIGTTPANNVEVYASRLLKQRTDYNNVITWDRVEAFPQMDLEWSYIHFIYFPSLVPEMGRYCDLGHISDPAHRKELGEENPNLKLPEDNTSLAFDVIAQPNNKGYIVGPGDYQLKLLIAAQNSRPQEKTVLISLKGKWYADEANMRQYGVSVTLQ